jgi:hypothetical protein
MCARYGAGVQVIPMCAREAELKRAVPVCERKAQLGRRGCRKRRWRRKRRGARHKQVRVSAHPSGYMGTSISLEKNVDGLL